MYVYVCIGSGNAQGGGVRVDDDAAMDVVKQVVVIEPEAHSVKDSEQTVPEQQQQQQKSLEKESSKGPTMNSLQLLAGPV